jgi:O-antigen/teichoic acid export membrane protein
MLAPDDVPSPTDGRVASNASWMAASAAIAILQGVAVAFVMSRQLGVVAFGQLGLIMSCTNVVLFASGSSVANALRESARARFERSMVGSAILAQLVLAIPVLLAALVVLVVASNEPRLVGPAAMLGVALVLRTAPGPVVGFYLGRERMVWQMLDSAYALVTLAALLACVAFGAELYALPVASLGAAAVVTSIAAVGLAHRLPAGSFRPNRTTVRMLVVPTLLWSAATLAQQIQWAVEPLLAPRVMGPTDVGLFVAGNRLLPPVRSVASALGLVFLPAFVRAVRDHDARLLFARARSSLRYLLAAGWALAALLFVAAPWITALLYPPAFAETTTIIRWLSLSAPALFIHWRALCLLFAADALGALLACYVLALAARLAIGCWLGATHGAAGLAAAEATSDWILALTTHVVAFRVLSLRYRDPGACRTRDSTPSRG